MVSRLFGRGKKPTPQEPQPTISTSVNEFEDEGFTIVNSNPPAKSDGPMYPSLSGFPQPSASSGENKSPSLGAGANISHYLDGVPFALSCQCSFGGDQFDATTARIENLAERLKFVNWASMDYDFNVEKSVVQDIGITDTLRRLHAS